ncbi:hypothetical protein O181_102664 [Austropuccinia psidii MF-1]|uniref:CCHC-type domain-containing protein n=1 Tax=Austropuccinia psidii MF-1 TaxID=1389203 RepID=A0A9Q3JIY7_9BASI|nr:hypothetical protein [Austropuccinia psidii MF-1]
MHQFINSAINTLMTKTPNIKVHLNDLLRTIWKIATASPGFNRSTELTRINAVSKFGRRESRSNSNQRQSINHNSKHKPKHKPVLSQSHKNDSQTPSSRYPCHYCGEVGHWLANCPVRAKANEARSGSQFQNVNVSRIGVVPMIENDAALLDSGAMHSVVGNISLFTSLVKTDMTLSVVSS